MVTCHFIKYYTTSFDTLNFRYQLFGKPKDKPSELSPKNPQKEAFTSATILLNPFPECDLVFLTQLTVTTFCFLMRTFGVTDIFFSESR